MSVLFWVGTLVKGFFQVWWAVGSLSDWWGAGNVGRHAKRWFEECCSTMSVLVIVLTPLSPQTRLRDVVFTKEQMHDLEDILVLVLAMDSRFLSCACVVVAHGSARYTCQAFRIP